MCSSSGNGTHVAIYIYTVPQATKNTGIIQLDPTSKLAGSLLSTVVSMHTLQKILLSITATVVDRRQSKGIYNFKH